MNHRFHRLYAVTLIVLVSLSGCSKETVTETVEVVRPAKLIEVTKSNNERRFSFPAIIDAASSTDLTFTVSGQIDKFLVIEGEEVKRGQVIARLDQRNFRNSLTTAQSQLDSAQSEFERAQRLIDANAIARNVYEQRKSSLEVAQAQLDTARKALEDTVLRSPYDGVVAVKQAKELQSVQPSETIVTLQSTGAAEAIVQIPASLVAKSSRINPVSAVIVLDAAPGIEIPAQFKSGNAKADEATQTFKVTFGFLPPGDLTILPGMTGTVNSVLEIGDESVQSEQVSVPLGAVLSDGDARYVWLVDKANMTVSRRDVQVGAGINSTLAVQSGLAAGDTIVGAGASYLHEGMKIRAYDQP